MFITAHYRTLFPLIGSIAMYFKTVGNGQNFKLEASCYFLYLIENQHFTNYNFPDWIAFIAIFDNSKTP
jgi:hypothetical protein